MNTLSDKFNLYLSISNSWPLDDWSITKECFDKIVEMLQFGSTILEIGSGNSTKILSHFYKMISIESNIEWMNKYNSEYIYVPPKKFNSEIFGETNWIDVDILKSSLDGKKYDLLIFDDTMAESYLKCANLVAKKLNKICTTYHCKVNKYAVTWFKGKMFSLIL